MSGGVVIGSSIQPVPGVPVVNYLQVPKIKLPNEDGMRRTSRVTCIVLHSTLGAPDRQFVHPQTLLGGSGPSTNLGESLIGLWANDRRCAGAHLGVDFDGMVYCLQDLLKWETFHATTVNHCSIGIEYKQGRKQSEFYEHQLVQGAALVKWLAITFKIQLMIPRGYINKSIPRLRNGAKNFWGIFGHRDQSDNRGAGDPGDIIMDSISRIGAESFDLNKNEDIEMWKKRQKWLGISTLDGIPGPATNDALASRGFLHGQWVMPPPGICIPAELITPGSRSAVSL